MFDRDASACRVKNSPSNVSNCFKDECDVGQMRSPIHRSFLVPMQPIPQRLTFAGLFVGVFLSIFLCQCDVCMSRQDWFRFAPSFVVLLAALATFAVPLSTLKSEHVQRVFRECLGAILAFALIAVVAWAGAALPRANLADGWRYVVFPTVDFLVFLLALPLACLFASRANWRTACGIALVALVLSILTDVRYPGTFSFLETRAAGFGVNPNIGASLVSLLLVGVLDWKRPTLSLSTCAWCLLALIGVFMTLSRSGILVLGIIGLMYLRLCLKRNGMGTFIVMSGIALIFAGYATVSSDAARSLLPMFDARHSRMSFFSGEFDAMDVREDSRVYLIYDYLKLISERPLLGWGTGLNYAMDVGSHNMFLARWVENGLPGLAAYLLLIVMLYRIGRRFQSWECIAVAVYLATESFFSHNLLEDKSLLLVMAITAGRAVLNGPETTGATTAVHGNSTISYSRAVPLARAG